MLKKIANNQILSRELIINREEGFLKIPIKVLFLIHKINIGGAEQRLLDFLRNESSNKNFAIKVLCLNEMGVIGKEISKLGIIVDVLNQTNYLGKLLKLRSYLIKERPHIIHLHLWPARHYTFAVRLFSWCSIIYTVEDQQDSMEWHDRILERLFYSVTTKIVAVSEGSRQSYIDKIKVKGTKITTIYNGVDVNKFANQKADFIRKEFSISQKDIIITTVSRLVEKKGHIFLVKAAKILQEKYENLKFLFVGEGDYRDKIQEEIRKVKLDDSFIFTGKRRDISDILSITDIFVLPSMRDEGQGIAIIEAMAAGRAVVTTNIEGINEVANNTNAIVVPPMDYIQLARGIEELIGDKEKRLRLGNEARQHIALKFSLQSMCNSYERLYLKITGNILLKQNILYIENSSGFGGSSNALANLVNNLNTVRFRPIIVIKNIGSQIEKIRGAEIIKFKDYTEPEKLTSLAFFAYLITKVLPEVVKICLVIKNKKISLMHINTNIFTGISAIIAARLFGIPCICYIRATRKITKREKIFSKWVNKFIILNKVAFEGYEQHIPSEKIEIIYDGVDLDDYQGKDKGILRKEFNLNSAPVVGTIGRIVEGKGNKEFILTAKEVLKKCPSVKFVIIGEAKGGEQVYFDEVKDLIRTEKLEENFVFTGWRNDLNQIIPDLDLIVQPYTSPEGLPNTLIEAMALAKPVISTNISGPSEIVVDGETGFLVPTKDIKVLAEKIIYLLENPHIAKKMGEAGRKRVEELFDIKKNVKKIEEIYEEILKEK